MSERIKVSQSIDKRGDCDCGWIGGNSPYIYLRPTGVGLMSDCAHESDKCIKFPSGLSDRL